jgi:N-acetylglutamate synthase-like GNAT family acetyltransferase
MNPSHKGDTKFIFVTGGAVSALGKGIAAASLGRLLVERVISEAKARGVEALYLLTPTAEHYFPSFGFSKVEREGVPDEVKATEEFSSACPSSAAVMRLPMSA